MKFGVSEQLFFMARGDFQILVPPAAELLVERNRPPGFRAIVRFPVIVASSIEHGIKLSFRERAVIKSRQKISYAFQHVRHRLLDGPFAASILRDRTRGPKQS